jgi:hypothetical protein
MPPGARSRAGGQYLGQHDGQEAAAGFREDTGDMDRGRAETHLRQLAESGFAAKVFPVIFGSKWQEIVVVIWPSRWRRASSQVSD